MRPREVELRFYEELNDFLPREKRKRTFAHPFAGTPAIKDVIESLGVPHTEVDLILVDGESVGFEHRVRGGERVAVFPTFERFDIGDVNRLRDRPLREPRFIADVHLGKLARYLRLLGFDTAYENDLDDPSIVARSREEHRIILTRDRGLLKRTAVTHGYFVREKRPLKQLREVVRALGLETRTAPFSRCMKCNGLLRPVPKEAVAALLHPPTLLNYDSFLKCEACENVYWPGAHFRRLSAIVDSMSAIQRLDLDPDM